MQAFFESGRIIDVILLIVAIEAVVVVILRHRLAGLFDMRGFFVSLVSGVCLMVALRGALTGAPWTFIAPFLVASLIAHLIDVAQRWRGGRTP
jgi:hypothetical protein